MCKGEGMEWGAHRTEKGQERKRKKEPDNPSPLSSLLPPLLVWGPTEKCAYVHDASAAATERESGAATLSLAPIFFFPDVSLFSKASTVLTIERDTASRRGKCEKLRRKMPHSATTVGKEKTR